MLVRDADADDAPAVAALLDQLGYAADAAEVDARLERLRIVGDRVVVAEVEGVVAGVAHLHVSPALEHERPAARLAVLVVAEAHRRRGVGRALVRAVEVEARSRGCAVLFVTTAERRADARRFYEQVGLAETGRRYAKALDGPSSSSASSPTVSPGSS